MPQCHHIVYFLAKTVGQLQKIALLQNSLKAEHQLYMMLRRANYLNSVV